MKKKLLIVLITVFVFTGVCVLLWQGVDSDDNVSSSEAENSKKIATRLAKKKREKVLSPEMTRTQKLKILYSKPQLTSDKVTKIMDKTNGLKFRERLRMVHSLSRNLSFEDKKALYHYLKYEENNRQTHVMKNDMLNILRDQKVPPPELTDVMLDLFYDKSEGIVVRCYALQHMRPWYLDERMQDPAIRQAFYDGLKETENEIAGVALLALRYMAQNDEAFDEDFVSQKAAEMAADENTYILTRISAVGVCGKMKTKKALETVRNLTNTAQPITLRVSAIATLGEIGDPTDIKTLTEISSTSKRPFSMAARVALNKLKKKYH